MQNQNNVTNVTPSFPIIITYRTTIFSFHTIYLLQECCLTQSNHHLKKEKKTMKKFYFLLLIALSAVLSACNFTQEGNSKATLSNTAHTILTSEQPENLSDLQSNYLKRQEQFKAEQSENI